ncbi:MAG: hypothetical protein ACRD96_08490, partial [Bryobacteraceae bacterium]
MAAAIAMLAAAGAAPGETQAERGKRVVDEALAAMGGARFLAMRDRIEAGRAYSFYREELSGRALAKIYTRYLTPEAGKVGLRERQAFGKDEDNVVLLGDTGGYEVNFRGARPMNDAALERFQESTLRNVFYILRQRLGEKGLVVESRGSDIVDNQPVELVEIADASNRQVTVAFHRSTKLPVRQTTVRRDSRTNER